VEDSGAGQRQVLSAHVTTTLCKTEQPAGDGVQYHLVGRPPHANGPRVNGKHMIYMPTALNPFDFVVVASLRTKQLIAGCVPRVTRAHKLTSTAALEVLAGKIGRLPQAKPPA
jgi:DNA-directed RNA polymerase subunit K/omega